MHTKWRWRQILDERCQESLSDFEKYALNWRGSPRRKLFLLRMLTHSSEVCPFENLSVVEKGISSIKGSCTKQSDQCARPYEEISFPTASGTRWNISMTKCLVIRGEVCVGKKFSWRHWLFCQNLYVEVSLSGTPFFHSLLIDLCRFFEECKSYSFFFFSLKASLKQPGLFIRQEVKLKVSLFMSCDINSN